MAHTENMLKDLKAYGKNSANIWILYLIQVTTYQVN